MVLVTLMLSVMSVSLQAENGTTHKPTYTVLHRFTGGGDGGNPVASLVRDASGNLYGTTRVGGSFNYGTVFKIEPSGKETVLHNFAGADGMWPEGPLLLDQSGNLYGTATNGGTAEGGNCDFGCGTVFKIDKAGKYTVLYAFTGGADGGDPASSLLLDGAGNLYGTTQGGGINGYDCIDGGCGVVFKIDPHGKETILCTFNRSNGAEPIGGLIRDEAGNLFGTAYTGGSSTWYGAVFKIDSAGVETVVYNFTDGTNGAGPQGTLVPDEAGNLYGVTDRGGDDSIQQCTSGSWYGCGVVFKLDSHGNESILYTFTDGSDGSFPNGGLLRGRAGELYGTTPSLPGGNLFKLGADGKFYLLHTFEEQTGYYPESGVITDSAGNLYGTTYSGGLAKCGNYGCGVVYKWEP
jgi:uncharacterized repeat protein (TIGR03803 family)